MTNIAFENKFALTRHSAINVTGKNNPSKIHLFSFYPLNTREFAFNPGNTVQRIQRENCSLKGEESFRKTLISFKN